MEEKPGLAFRILEGLLAAITLMVFLGVILPIIGLIFIPLHLHRWILMLYVKLFRKDFVRIMTGKNPVLAIDDVNSRPLCTIVGYGAFDGANVEHMVQVTSQCVNACDDTKQLLHPETHQYYEEWMGYMWWKWEKDWKLENHISVWDEGKNTDSPVLEKDFMNIIAILEAKSFPKGTSPWEVVLVKNVLLQNVRNSDVPKMAIIFRV